MQSNREHIGWPLNIKKLLSSLIVISFIVLQSCVLQDLAEFDCSECYPEKPTHSWVELRLTINEENPEVPITIYLGPPENGVIYAQELAYESTYKVMVENEIPYTVKAEYKVNGKTHIVFSQIKTKLFYDYESCSEPCYWVSNKRVRLRIKN